MSRGLWVKVSADLPRHAKLYRLARRLGIPRREAFYYVVNLWLFALNSFPDGLLPIESEVIAFGCDLDESIDPETFVHELVKCGEPRAGFLDFKLNGYQIHDWECFTGGLTEQREQMRERSRRYRERKKLRIQPTLSERDVTQMSLRDDTVAYHENHAEEQEQEQEQEKVKPIVSREPAPASESTIPQLSQAPKSQKKVSQVAFQDRLGYEAEFSELWSLYPKRKNSGKQKAFEGYIRRRKEGATFDDMKRAVQSYAFYILQRGKSSEYTMMGSTFFGPNGRWKDFLDDGDVQLEYGGMMEPQKEQHFTDENQLISTTFGGDANEYARWVAAGSPEPASDWLRRRRGG